MPRPRSFPVLSAVCVVSALALVACGGAPPEPASYAPNEEPPPPPEQKLPPLPAGHVWRVDVMKVMSPGMPVFLQRLDVTEVLDSGKFHGFRITALHGDPAFWRGSGLQVGDVVTTVNGQAIGHYDQAFEVWSQLATASTLEVAYERGGQPKQLRLVIHDEEEVPGGAKPPAPAP